MADGGEEEDEGAGPAQDGGVASEDEDGGVAAEAPPPPASSRSWSNSKEVLSRVHRSKLATGGHFIAGRHQRIEIKSCETTLLKLAALIHQRIPEVLSYFSRMNQIFPGRGRAVHVADGRVKAHAGEARVGAAVPRP